MKQGYEGRAVNIWILVPGLMVTFFTALLTWGCILLCRYGPLIIISPIIWGSIAVGAWFNIAFGRIVVEEYGVVYERCPQRVWNLLSKLHLSKLIGLGIVDIFYGFETIEKIRVSGNVVNIMGGWLHSSGPVLIQNPKGFVEAVKRYAPDKLEEKSLRRRI